MDSDGYPKFFRDTIDMYFQKGGKWYRETAGPTATQYVLEGNNPHVGPYDGGAAFINQFNNLIPNFQPVTVTSTTVTTNTVNLFKASLIPLVTFHNVDILNIIDKDAQQFVFNNFDYEGYAIDLRHSYNVIDLNNYQVAIFHQY